MNKILSLIIPSYNMEAYLPKCLGSLIVDDKELLQKLDVIVVNDGSTDRTSKIAHEFETKYPGVFRVIDKENGHYGSCINAALPLANGTFVKVLDADDSYVTDALTRLIIKLSTISNEVDMVLTDHAFVDSEGNVREKPGLRLTTNAPCDIADIIPDYDQVMIWNTAYRKSVLNKAGYFQTEGIAYTDLEWVSVPVAYVRKLYHMPVCLYLYSAEREGQSMSASIVSKSADMFETVLDDMMLAYDKQRMSFGKDATLFFSLQIYRQARIIYGLYLYRLSILDAVRRLSLMDDKLSRQNGELFDKLAYAFLVGPGHGLYIVKMYRKAVGARMLVICGLRLYIALTKIVCKWR